MSGVVSTVRGSANDIIREFNRMKRNARSTKRTIEQVSRSLRESEQRRFEHRRDMNRRRADLSRPPPTDRLPDRSSGRVRASDGNINVELSLDGRKLAEGVTDAQDEWISSTTTR